MTRILDIRMLRYQFSEDEAIFYESLMEFKVYQNAQMYLLSADHKFIAWMVLDLDRSEFESSFRKDVASNDSGLNTLANMWDDQMNMKLIFELYRLKGFSRYIMDKSNAWGTKKWDVFLEGEHRFSQDTYKTDVTYLTLVTD